MQDISLNPQKLAGQCSKLKCCMMYEYDTYVDARKEFPRLREPLQAAEGEWFCVKSDVLAGTMTFSSSKEAMANVTTLPVSRVREIMALNRQGKKVERLQDADDIRPEIEDRPTVRGGQHHPLRPAKRRKRGRPQQQGRGEQGRPAGRTDRRRRSPAERPASRVKDSPAVPTGSRAATTVRATEATQGSVRTAATAATASVRTTATAAATITEAKTTAARTTAANPVKTTEAAARAETAAATTATAAAETETTAETPRPGNNGNGGSSEGGNNGGTHQNQ